MNDNVNTNEVEETTRPSALVQDNLPGELPVFNPDLPKPSLAELEEALRDVIDPELMINIVDLGLVYGIHLDDELNCTLDMTLTSPTCPLTDRIEYEVKFVLAEYTRSVTVNWVWLPAWSIERISDDGREQLRAMGFHI